MTERLDEKEKRRAAVLLFAHILLFPLLVSLCAFRFHEALTTAEYNLLYYGVSSLLCVLFLGKYLRRSFESLKNEPKKTLTALIFGCALFLLLTALFGFLLKALGIDGTDPNSQSVNEMMDSQGFITLLLTVLFAPFVEETLFRGGVFCALYDKGRLYAYLVTTVLFSVYHVWQFAYSSGDWHALLYAAAYIPASVTLCFIYEKSGTVWAGMLFHAGYNLFARLFSL